MNGILITTVLVLAVLAVIQIVRIYEMSSAIRNEDTAIPTPEDNDRQGLWMLLFGIAFIVSFFAMVAAWMPETLGTPASEHGPQYDNLWDISMGIILVMFLIVQPVLFYFAYKYRGTAGRKASYFEHNNKLELIWTVVPAVVLAVLILYGLSTWNTIMHPSKDKEPIVIELYAQQFKWTARYSGKDNELGAASVRMIAGTNTVGVDTLDPKAADDKITGELYLPVGRPVLFKFRSQDVIHSAYMPHFRAQMNCVPGVPTQFQFTPTVTTADIRKDADMVAKIARVNAVRAKAGKEAYTFDYVLLCNKICGSAHYNMQMPIVVVSEEEYAAWLKEQKSVSETL
jgi:cytochrome c oxidase subunit 2